jgi:hypothetical protein
MKSRIGLSVALLGAFVLGVVSVHPIAKAVEMLAIVNCAATTPTPCTGGANSKNGPGVLGTSVNGHGVWGQTKYPSKSGSNFKAGTLGQDLSTTGKFDVGVLGTSTRGTGVLGTSSSYIGLNGISNSNTGVWGQVNGGTKEPTGVFGVDASKSANGAGLAGQTNAGTGVVGTTLSSGSSSQALLGLAPNGAYVFVGAGSGNNAVATLDSSGNLTIAGLIYTSGNCYSGCNSGPRREQSYGETAATPTIEDSGEAQLVAGVATVRIDPNFSNAIDPHQGYFVLITPEGDTRGLYVAQRAARGFIVRETMGGRSSLPFAYRIVAHPYGVRAPRLPYVTLRTVQPVVRTPQ